MPIFERKGSSVDYSKRNNDRRKMTNYLRTGNFKKIAGSPIYGASVTRRRAWLMVIGSVVIAIGLYYVIF